MQYYWLIQSTNEDIGKGSSQVKGMIDGYDLYADNSVWKIPYFSIPDIEPNFDALQLYNNAFRTDIIIPSGLIPSTGFYVSEKAKEILSHFKLPKHLYYKARVMHKNKVYDHYFWIQFTQEMSHLIDFENSVFDLKESFGWQNWLEVENNLKFNDTAELIHFYKSKNPMNDIVPNKLNMIIDTDIYCFNYFGNSILVSEQLKNALNSSDIKGIELIKF